MKENLFKCECENCNEESMVSKFNLYPTKEMGLDGEEILNFQIRCPKCGNFNEFDVENIPTDIAIERMQYNAGIADEAIMLQEIERQIIELSKIRNNILETILIRVSDTNRDVNHLYDNWLPNEEVVANAKSLIKRK